MILVVEKAINLGDIRVLQRGLYFNLSDKLGQEVLRYDSPFLNHLQRYHESCLFLNCEINTSELAFSQFLNYLKIVYSYFLKVAMKRCINFIAFRRGALLQFLAILGAIL